MRENREKPILSFAYRHLKLYEKKRILRSHKPEIVVNIKATEEIYQKEVERLQLINAYMTGRTLDVGSKFGLVTKGENVVALDSVKGHLQLNVHKDKILADACKLPFINGSFETIVEAEILEHLEHPDVAVKEARRTLKRNGRVVISVPDRFSCFSEPTHIHYFTEKKVRRLFRDFEVEVCRAISTGHIFGVFKAIE